MEDDRTDLAARLAAAYRLLPQAGVINKYDSMYERSTGQRTSMAVHARSEAPSTTASDNIPSLTRGNSNASSTGSAHTDFASALDGMRTLESIDGVLYVPETTHPHADLICPFQILDCAEPFSDIRFWKTHVFSHFRGHPCPKIASCFLCESVFNDQSDDDDPARAWNEMLSHMAAVHFRGMGQRLATVRADFALMKWMFSRGLVTHAQFRRVQMMPVPIMLPGSAGDIVNAPEAPMAPPRPPAPAVPSASGPGRESEFDVLTFQASSLRDGRNRRNRRP